MAAGMGGDSDYASANRPHCNFVVVLDLVGHRGNPAVLAARAIYAQPRHGAHQVLVAADVVGMPMRRQHGHQVEPAPAYLGKHLVRLRAVNHAALFARVVDYQVGVVVFKLGHRNNRHRSTPLKIHFDAGAFGRIHNPTIL